jgi:hypothetical protein
MKHVQNNIVQVQYAIVGHRQSMYMNNIHVLHVRSLLTSNINFFLKNLEGQGPYSNLLNMKTTEFIQEYRQTKKKERRTTTQSRESKQGAI